MAEIAGVIAGDHTNLFDDWWQFVMLLSYSYSNVITDTS